MPELPEVEMFRRRIERCCLRRRIGSAEAKNSKVLLKGCSEKIGERLRGREFLSADRVGKWLFLSMDNGKWFVMHFGMTGSPETFESMKKEPKYDRFLINFQDGGHLCLDDPRILGRVGFLDSKEDFLRRKKLGVDALQMSLEEFKEAMKGRKGRVKSVLMDQSVVAGIGNIYSDEILFQVGIHPLTPANELSDIELTEMFKVTKEVLEKSIEVRTNFRKLPDHFLLRNRKRGERCPGTGSTLETVKVGGRTAYFCPKRQKLRR